MPTTETIVLDPNQFIPTRTELPLDTLGLRVREADWGDAEHELFLIRQSRGEIPADRHPPNRTVTLKLRARPEGEVSLAEAAQKLQMKVGRLQEEAGWVRRDMDAAGGFRTSVAAIVYTAVLGGLHGWLMAHRKTAPDVTLVLTIGPYFYGVEELETGEFKETEDRQLIYTVPNYVGTAPGIRRAIVSNDNGEEGLRGFIAAWESRDYVKGTTAELEYEAEDLTLLGTAEIKERAGASGNKIVRIGNLSAGWIGLISSEINGVGHMTHVGARRMFARVYDPSEELGEVDLRLRWRSLGSMAWLTNRAASAYVVGDYVILDFGQCKPERGILGNQQWEWKLEGRAPSGSGSVDLDIFWPVPVEQMLSVRVPGISSGASKTFLKAPAGVTNRKEAEGYAPWATPENAKASDNVYTKAVLNGFPSGPLASNYLVASNLGFTIPADASIVDIVVEIERHSTVANTISDAMLTVTSDKEKEDEPEWRWGGTEYWPTVDASKFYSGVTASKSGTFSPSNVNSADFAVWAWVYNETFETSTAEVDYIAVTVYYAEGSDEDRVCFAERKVELRSDGVFRESLTGNVWGRLVPDGFLPITSPSGLEERPTRGILIPTQGDLQKLADGGTNKLSVVERYYPGYHFTSEATP